MIGKVVEEILLEDGDYLIPAKNVVTLMEFHPLNHALLVLSQARYSKVCVLNRKDQLVGLISLSDILSASFNTTGIDNEKLKEQTIGDIMETDVSSLIYPCSTEKILHEMVDLPFIPVVDEENHFTGIITRRELLKGVNRLAHVLESQYTLVPKSEKYLKNEAYG